MSGRIIHFEGSAHTEADRLLPWLANGTLEGEELMRVRAHLDQCAACRNELDWLRSLQGAYAEEATPVPPPRLSRRLRHLTASHSTRRHNRSRWQPWLIAAQTAVMLVMGLALLQYQRPVPGLYHTLAAPAVARDRLVVVFDPALSEMRMRRLLQACDAHVVDGPTAAGAWVLSVPSARADAVREALRAAPGVTLVERLDVGR